LGRAQVRIRNPRHSIGDDKESMLAATTKVCEFRYPEIENWDEREEEKKEHVREKITEFLQNN